MAAAAPFTVRKAAVLGAGVMGAQIAAHLVNANVAAVLYELPAREGDPNGNVLKAIETGLVDSVQVVYNVFDQAPEDALFPACQQAGTAVIARVPFDEGSLTGTLRFDARWPQGDWRNLYFTPDRLRETLARTTAGQLAAGDRVNLERSMRLDGRLDGHLVQGHVDGVGTVRSVADEGGSRRVVITLPANLAPYVAEKGSIAVDGTSLTVTRADRDAFEVALIPHTLEHTVAGSYRSGVRVNLEVDLVARYVARLMATSGEQT